MSCAAALFVLGVCGMLERGGLRWGRGVKLGPEKKQVAINIKVPGEWKELVDRAAELKKVDKNKVWNLLISESVEVLKKELKAAP